MAVDVGIKITGDVSDAVKSLKTLEGSFKVLKTVAVAAVGVFAGKQLINALDSVIEAAIAQEKAVKRLNTALKSTGEFSDDASKSMIEFAEAIQRVTEFDDDLIVEQLALAKSFGISNDQAKALVSTATDLAAATGVSLDTAVEQLGKTFSGTTGLLSKQIPALKDLSEQQLKSGAAIDIVRQKFAGFAEETTKTFGGAISQTKNVFGDLLEEIGKIITQNPDVIAAIQLIKGGLLQFIDVVKDNQKAISELLSLAFNGLKVAITGAFDAANKFAHVFDGVDLEKIAVSIASIGAAFLTISTAGPAIAAGFAGLASVFQVLGAKDGFLFLLLKGQDFAKAAASLGLLAGKAVLFGSGIAAAVLALDIFIRNIGRLDELGSTIIEGLRLAVVRISGAFAALNVSANRALFSIVVTLNKVGLATDEFVERASQGVQGALDAQIHFLKESVKATNKLNEAAKDIDFGLAGELNKVIKNIFKDSEEIAEGSGIALGESAGKGLSAGISQSKIGLEDLFKTAEKLLSDTAGLFTFEGAINKLNDLVSQLKPEDIIQAGVSVANAVSGAIIDGTATMIKFLSGGFLKDFLGVVKDLDKLPGEMLQIFEELDTVLQNFISNAPAIIESIFEKIPELVDSIVEALGKFIDILIKNAPKFFDVIIDAMLKIFDKLLEALPKIIDKLPEIFQKFVDGIVSAFEILLKRLPAIITAIFDALPEIVRTIAAAIPQIVEIFAQNIGPIVQALVTGISIAIPEIVEALVDELIVKGGVFRIAVALAQAFALELPKALLLSGGDVFQHFGTRLFEGFKFEFPKLGEAFVDFGRIFSENIKFPEIGEPKFIATFRDMLENIEPRFIKDFRELLGKPLQVAGLPGGGGGGGDGGLFGVPGTGKGSKSGVPGSPIATGGLVPGGFPNDNFPARLTSGELVIPKGDTQRLSEFLDREGANNSEILAALERGGEKNMIVNLQVGEQQLASVMLNINRHGFRTA